MIGLIGITLSYTRGIVWKMFINGLAGEFPQNFFSSGCFKQIILLIEFHFFTMTFVSIKFCKINKCTTCGG